MSCAEGSVRGLVSAGTGAARTADPESPGLRTGGAGAGWDTRLPPGPWEWEGLPNLPLTQDESVPGMWGAGGIHVLRQGILTGCCALGDQMGGECFQQPLAAGENGTRQMSSSLVLCLLSLSLKCSRNQIMPTRDVGAEEACNVPQRWCCSHEQWLILWEA